MNNQIKFRGFYKEKPVVFDFNLLFGDRCGVPCVDINGESISIYLLENIGRFTGVKDENGIDIYEGDKVYILEFGDRGEKYEFACRVKFNNKKGCFYAELEEKMSLQGRYSKLFSLEREKPELIRVLY